MEGELQYRRLDTQTTDVPPRALVYAKIRQGDYEGFGRNVFDPVARPIPPFLTPEMMPRPQPDPTDLWVRRKLRSHYAKIYFYS